MSIRKDRYPEKDKICNFSITIVFKSIALFVDQ